MYIDREEIFESGNNTKGRRDVKSTNQTSSFIPLLSQFLSGFILGMIMGKGNRKNNKEFSNLSSPTSKKQ